jgi:hypothetical protein
MTVTNYRGEITKDALPLPKTEEIATVVDNI